MKILIFHLIVAIVATIGIAGVVLDAPMPFNTFIIGFDIAYLLGWALKVHRK